MKDKLKPYVDILIIGGGASGMTAAIAAAEHAQENKTIAIIERHSIAGRKILATGNGTCNITNIHSDFENTSKYFHGNNINSIQNILSMMSPQNTIDFFSKLGVFCSAEPDGRVYPICKQAYAVRNALERKATELGVCICTKLEVFDIKKENDIFTVNCFEPDIRDYKDRTGNIRTSIGINSKKLRSEILSFGYINASKVIIASGGKASPSLSSNGKGYNLAIALGHSLSQIYPGITRLKTNSAFKSDISGVRIDANLVLYEYSKKIANEKGEILFTNEGISGPAALQLSGLIKPDKKYKIIVDFLPDYSPSDLKKKLIQLVKDISDRNILELFDGVFSAKLSKAFGILNFNNSPNKKISSITIDDIDKIILQIKSFPFEVLGNDGWAEAQITAGGILLSEFNMNTLESNICPGLYLSGEILDATGCCGGFNLQFAWASGFMSGKHSAGSLLVL